MFTFTVYAGDSVGPFPAISDARHLMRLVVPFGKVRFSFISILFPFSKPAIGIQGPQFMPELVEIIYSTVVASTPEVRSEIVILTSTFSNADSSVSNGLAFEKITFCVSTIIR